VLKICGRLGGSMVEGAPQPRFGEASMKGALNGLGAPAKQYDNLNNSDTCGLVVVCQLDLWPKP